MMAERLVDEIVVPTLPRRSSGRGRLRKITYQLADAALALELDAGLLRTVLAPSQPTR
jgi:hypothetical protein